MKLKEFEGKQLFQKVGIIVSKGTVIRSVSEIQEFSGSRLLKVQTIAGGRGKAGGIILVNNSKEAKEKAAEFLGQEFLGEKITEIVLDEKIDIKKELYLGLLFNTKKRVPVFIFSTEGGVEIEELQLNSPEKIKLQEIDILTGLTDEDCDILLDGSSLGSDVTLQLKVVMNQLWKCFTEFDCKMLEVNPLVITGDDKLVAVDSVIVLDDDANYRREIKFPKRLDGREKTAREIAANKIDEND